MKIKTKELSGAALDWAVAVCKGYTDWCGETERFLPPRPEYGWVDLHYLNYSTDWSQGGLVIEAQEIAIWPDGESSGWFASANEGRGVDYKGSTPLVAAMRCFVTSKLGDEVDVPEGLM